MEPLTGLGIWIWQLAACGTFESIIDRATRCGISWIAIKGGESVKATQIKYITPTIIDHFAERGITLATWWYSRPDTTAHELEVVKSLRDVNGFKHFICDAEIEWEQGGDHRAEAVKYAEALRDTLGDDCFLADAPWPIRHSHPLYPFDQFGAVMDLRMPQVYWKIHGGDAARFFRESDAEWDHEPPHRVCPVGSSVNYNGTQHSPVSDVAGFLDYFANAPATSLWSWQHMTPEEWALLEQRARHDSPAGCDLT